ncbi:hypothetical protein [Kitasatospora brasiliensis]|uniref:hypothetical protein n=1 Tax=Kitasatospora brasiliensis TaxID=3058040 RepID=UPI00293055E8|nr:hypothetical protein [Kitasatospora sp. K002]
MSGVTDREPAGKGPDVWVGLGLAEAAGGARIGPAPVADIMAGGRRLRRRRRTVVGAAVLAAAVALAGGAVAQLRPDRAASQVAPAGVGTVPAPTHSPTATPAVRDPLTPVRTLVGEGTTPGGKPWQLWAALWPLAPKERAFEQATAVREELRRYDAKVELPTEEYVRQYWQPDDDVITVYLMVDGVRLGHALEWDLPAPGKVPPTMQTNVNGGLVARSSKDGIVPPVDLVHFMLGPDVGRVVVTWEDGSTTEPQAVTMGDSPFREMAVARKGTMLAKSWAFYDKDGKLIPEADGAYLN